MKKLLFAVLGFFVGVPAAGAAPLFTTTLNANAAYGSDYGDNAGFRTYDNFLLGTTSLVESLTWDFLFIDLANPAPVPAPTDDVQQWTVSFHADAAGTPGAPLATYTFTPAQVTSSLIGFGTYGVGGNTFNISSYHYSADLPSDFLAQGGTTYWLSVFAQSDAYYPIAAWRGGSGGLGPSTFQQQLGPDMSVVDADMIASDRSFSLEGRVVPEPATLLLMATGLGAAIIRRKKA